jgi:hypothetical protein
MLCSQIRPLGTLDDHDNEPQVASLDDHDNEPQVASLDDHDNEPQVASLDDHDNEPQVASHMHCVWSSMHSALTPSSRLIYFDYV